MVFFSQKKKLMMSAAFFVISNNITTALAGVQDMEHTSGLRTVLASRNGLGVNVAR